MLLAQHIKPKLAQEQPTFGWYNHACGKSMEQFVKPDNHMPVIQILVPGLFFLDPLNFDIQRSCRIPPNHPKPVPWRPKADLQQPRCDLGRPRCRWEAAKKRGWAKWGPCEAGLGGKAWETHQFFREKPWNPWVINYIGKWISTWLYDYQWDDVGWAWWFQDPRISCRRSRRTMTAWILWCLAKS